LNIPADQLGEVSEQATREAKRAFDDGYTIFKEYRKSEDINLLLQSQPHFERALRLNRETNNYVVAINTVYSLLESYYRNQKNQRFYQTAIRLGERLWRLNAENRGNYEIYYRLGLCYIELEGVPRTQDYALINFQKAETYGSDRMTMARASGDTASVQRLENDLFKILSYQVKIYDTYGPPRGVLRNVEKATAYATDDREKEILNYYQNRSTAWLFWEDREAMEIVQTEIRRFENNEKFDEARKLYKKLLAKFPSMTDRRRVEAERLYALFEFENLNQKVKAIERLLPYVQGRDSLGHIENIQALYNNFSQMCFGYGNEQVNKDRFVAYCYYKQGQMVPSDFHERISIRILTLCEENTQELIQLGSELWKMKDRLTDGEKVWLCERLISAYKMMGDAGATRRFLQEYRNF